MGPDSYVRVHAERGGWTEEACTRMGKKVLAIVLESVDKWHGNGRLRLLMESCEDDRVDSLDAEAEGDVVIRAL